MQNTTPFSSDPNPDLTQTIRDVMMETSKAKIKGLIAGRKRQADAAADQLANVNKAYLGVTGKPKLGTTHPKTAGTVGKAAQGDDRLIDAGNVFRKQEMIARRKQQNAEWRLKGNKGKDPRNESVEAVDEYTELLESVLLALCEELELDPNELVEAMRLTPARSAVLDRVNAGTKKTASQGSGMAQHNAVARRGRVDSLRAAAAGGDDKENRRAQQASDRETRPSPSRGKSYQQKYSHGS